MGDGFTISSDEVAAALGRGVLRAAEQRALDEARRALMNAIVMCVVRRVTYKALFARPAMYERTVLTEPGSMEARRLGRSVHGGDDG